MTIKIELPADVSASHQTVIAAIDAAINLLETELQKKRYQVKRGSVLYWMMRRDLPYQIHQLGDGVRCGSLKHGYTNPQILVNREYKPLGYIRFREDLSEWADVETDRTRVNYLEYPSSHIGIPDHEIRWLCVEWPNELGALYLDHCPPWRSRDDAYNYIGKLRRLRLWASRATP